MKQKLQYWARQISNAKGSNFKGEMYIRNDNQ